MNNYHQELVWKLIDQDLSEAEMAELEVLFENDSELRAYYQNCIETELTLESETTEFEQPTQPNRVLPILRLASIAAALTMVTWLSFSLLNKPSITAIQLSDSATFTPDRPVKTEYRAYHVASISALSETGQSEYTFLPYNLTSGTLEIDQGMVELSYPSGTTVTLTGPAKFELISSQSGWLHSGELALVKGGDQTFEVFHDQGKVIDVGTSFAMKIDANNQLDLYVRDGIVDIYDKNNLDLRRMVEGELLSQSGHQVEVSNQSKSPPNWAASQRQNMSKQTAEGQVKIQTATWLDGVVRSGKASGNINGVGIRLDSPAAANGGGLFEIDWAHCIPNLAQADHWYHSESAAIGCAAGETGLVTISLSTTITDPMLLFAWGEGTLVIDLEGFTIDTDRFYPAHESITLVNKKEINFGNLPERQNRPCQAAAIQLKGQFGPNKPLTFKLHSTDVRHESVGFTIAVES